MVSGELGLYYGWHRVSDFRSHKLIVLYTDCHLTDHAMTMLRVFVIPSTFFPSHSPLLATCHEPRDMCQEYFPYGELLRHVSTLLTHL